MRDAMDMLARNAANGSVGAGLNKLTSAESMAALIRNQQFESTPNMGGRLAADWQNFAKMLLFIFTKM
jgi:hypothetical protein